MTSRPGFLVSMRIPHESPPSPNSTQDFITVEIRMFWPPNVSTLTLLDHLAAASADAVTEVIVRTVDNPDGINSKIWLEEPPT